MVTAGDWLVGSRTGMSYRGYVVPVQAGVVQKPKKKLIICNVWSSTRFVSTTKLVRESWVSNDTDKRSQGSYSDHNLDDNDGEN